MCGIVGIIGGQEDKALIKRMLSQQSHRGPDNTSIWIDNTVQLGHNRLSIIDLSVNANQPFENEDYVLVFNGEIYNYLEIKEELKNDFSFTTNSDTEVLLKAYQKWGVDCLSKLNGMFAFAIWHKKEGNLIAVRDRFGVKPFFYTIIDETLYFASEIKSLFEAGIVKQANKKVWANYFCYGSYGLPKETFWENINQLPAGHTLEYTKQRKLIVSKWYFFEKEIEKYKNKKLSYIQAKEHYTSLLKDAIKLRFRADVPVGFNISGGLDSSALLAFVNNQKGAKKIQAFTFYTGNEKYDELPWVEEMIGLTKNPLNKILLTADEIIEKSKLISFHQDEPYGGIPTIAYAKIFEKAKEKGVTVLLDGQGMDEQWAGYDYYTQNNTNVIQGINKSPFRINVLSKDFLQYAKKPEYPMPFKDDLLNKQYRDLFYTKIPRALRFNDRVSMAFSTELREPFLDYRLVEFAFAQPKEFKIKDGVQKKILRDIVSEYLSDNISYAPKRPLQTPQREWLGEDLAPAVEKAIQNIETSSYSNWFDIEALKEEWRKYLAGDNDSSFHIWQWLNLELLIS